MGKISAFTRSKTFYKSYSSIFSISRWSHIISDYSSIVSDIYTHLLAIWQRDGFYRIEKGTCKTFHFTRWSGAAVLNSENTEIFEAWSKSFSWHCCCIVFPILKIVYNQLLSLQISMKYYFCIMGQILKEMCQKFFKLFFNNKVDVTCKKYKKYFSQNFICT